MYFPLALDHLSQINFNYAVKQLMYDSLENVTTTNSMTPVNLALLILTD